MKSDSGMLTEMENHRPGRPTNPAPGHANHLPTTGHRQINRGLVFMARNFDRPIQVKDIAAVCGLTRRGFIKAFCKHLRENPGAVLRRCRLEHAKKLLVTQDLKLKEIARQSGYRSENTFCVAFQRTLGLAPKQFQRQYWLTAYRTAESQAAKPPANRIKTKASRLHFKITSNATS